MEKSIVDNGLPDHIVKTTCAYCGVGCSFQAEMKGDQVVRMTPSKNGRANHGHSCVKGRFAWGYASHSDRILKPMVRERTSDPWREVSWEEAIGFAAERFKQIQEEYGRKVHRWNHFFPVHQRRSVCRPKAHPGRHGEQ